MAHTLLYNLINNDTEYEVSGYTGEPVDVVIPSEYSGLPVTSISGSALFFCHSLRSIEIPNSVTSIGSYAFCACDSLTSVVIPDSVTSIGGSAFESCSSLTTITILSKTPAVIGYEVFNDISNNAKFYCHSSAIEAYKTTANWNTYADKFIADDMRLYFTLNARAQKEYFASKDDLKAGAITDSELHSALQIEITNRTNADDDIITTIKPLTNEEIDTLWVDTPGTGEIPAFSMTNGFVPVWSEQNKTFEDGIALNEIGTLITVDQKYNKNSTNAQSGNAVAEAINALSDKLDEKLMNFRYFSVPAGKCYPLKRNGTYMIYNGKDANDKEQTISLLRRTDGVWANVCTGAKQLSLSTPVVAIDGRYTYQLCGIAYTGDSLVGIPTTDGFRQATTNYAYITSAGTMYVCESVQGKPLSIQDTPAKCIGPQGEAYKE